MLLTLNRAGRVVPRFNAVNGASFDRLFDEFFTPAARDTQAAAAIAARFDVVEKGDRFEARIEMPGVARDAIDVQIEGAVVRVKASAKAEVATHANDEASDGKADDSRVLHSTRTTRSWARSFTLPAEVDDARAEAAYVDGVLTLTLPKKEVVQPKRLAIK